MLECILCGACAWVCPSRLPLLDLFRASREELVHESQGFEVAGHWQQRFEYLQYRRRKQSRTAAKKKPGRKKQERGFSREKARAEIAAAVSRVKARRDSVIASSANKDSGGNGDG